MEKKGSGHLEVILSFTLFLFILLFILIYIRPLESNRLSEVTVLSLKQEFVEQTTVENIRIFAKSDDNSRCIPEHEISESLFNLNSTYKNISHSDNTFYIMFSNEFLGSLNNCTPGQNVSVGSTSRRNSISFTKLGAMQQKYYSDYSGLKQDLRIPEVLNFEIIGDIVNMSREKPQNIDILAKNYVLSVLDPNGEYLNKEFSFIVW